MGFAKGLLRVLAGAGFNMGLVGVAVSVALVMVFGNPSALKQALRDSRAYDNVADSTISDAVTANKDAASTATIPETQIKQAAKTAFTPGVLQSSTEQIIDGVYSWLRANSDKPDFRIDLTGQKQALAESLAGSAADRARQLPACGLQQLLELRGTTPDPFNIPCLPPGYDINALRSQAIADITNNQVFLKNPVITADSFPNDSQGRSVFENVSQAPELYQRLLLAPWVFGGLVLLSGLLLVLLHDNKRAGLKSLGMKLIMSGIFLPIGTAVVSYISRLLGRQVGRQVGRQLTAGLQQAPAEVIRLLSSAVNHKLIWFSAGYIILGALALLSLRLTRKPQQNSVINNPSATSFKS